MLSNDTTVHPRAWPRTPRSAICTDEQYQTLLAAQYGRCAICNAEETALAKSGQPRALAVDHDHGTGKIRGLLCSSCNRGIGYFKDDIVLLHNAINYLVDGSSAANASPARVRRRRVRTDVDWTPKPVITDLSGLATFGEPGTYGYAEERLRRETEATKTALAGDLRALGLSQVDRLLAEQEWVRLAQGLAFVREERRTGKVRNPAGLFVWWLTRQTGRPVFR